MKNLTVRLAAKTDVGLERKNNEDNFQLAQDLSSEKMQWINNQIFNIGNKGILLVVADGMGGMNAGEVASELAINTVRKQFQPSNLTEEVLRNRFSIEKFMKNVIQSADAEIKKAAKENPAHKGMGTTIVIAWIYDGLLYVSWCGDSRAYLYNPAHGLKQISKDHSYVQGLVDKGVISLEDAFDFPDSNIITRSLCDAGPKAVPDCLVTPIELCNNDIILLCSDGLNGMIRDKHIESVIASNQSNMDICVDSLIGSALHAAGADNVTIGLCQILEGGALASSDRKIGYTYHPSQNIDSEVPKAHSNEKWIIAIVSSLVIAGACFGGFWYKQSTNTSSVNDSLQVKTDTIKEEKPIIQDKVEQSIKEETQKTSTPKDMNHAEESNPFKSQDDDGGNAFKKGEKEKSELNITPIKSSGSETKESKTEGKTPEEKSMEDNKTELYDYKVKSGDTWTSLAKRFKISINELKATNGNKELKAGETIKMPKKL